MMNKRMKSSSFITLLVAATLSATLTKLIMRNLGFLPFGRGMTTDWLIAISFGLSVTSAFFTAFHRGVFLKIINPFGDGRSMISEVALVQSTATIFYLGHRINPATFFIATVGLQTWATYLSFGISTLGLQINHVILKRLPSVAAVTMASVGLLAWPVRNFWPIETLLVACAVCQAVIHIVFLVGPLLWFSMAQKYRLTGTTVWSTIKFRLAKDNDGISEWLTSTVTAFVQLSALILIISDLSRLGAPGGIVISLAAQFLFLPAFIDVWVKFDKAASDRDSLANFAKITSKSVRKLLSRLPHSSGNWAATIGLRTAIFTIDHDPENSMIHNMPATLVRIRNEEVLGFINQISQNHTLWTQSIAQKVIGTIDPEISIRPCVDALNLCATLYLDAGPLVERRVSGLVALLPIVNPGLANAIKVDLLGPLLKKNNWFFHFDYAWVDQSLISTTHTARYGIHVDPITEEARLGLLNHMRRSHSVGNFIWIGSDAHERLRQEAPNLTSIMEPHHIQLENSHELLLFSIKFEQLIPRLQRYYGLDEVRASVIDFEPRPEGKRLLSLLILQIQNAQTTQDQHRIIESIASFKWKGFKEKDQALRLLLQLYHQTQQLQSNPHSDSYVNALREAISSIGYPSQTLNQAQLFKLQLRDISKLQDHALNMNSSRFEESWILLGNLDFSRYTDDEIQKIRNIVRQAIRHRGLMKLTLVQAKLVNTCVSIIKRSPRQILAPDIALLNEVVETMIRADAQAECLTLALDAFTFINETTPKEQLNDKLTDKSPNKSAELSKVHRSALDRASPMSDTIVQHFDKILLQPPPPADTQQIAWIQSLKSRWLEYRSKFKSTTADDQWSQSA